MSENTINIPVTDLVRGAQIEYLGEFHEFVRTEDYPKTGVLRLYGIDCVLLCHDVRVPAYSEGWVRVASGDDVQARPPEVTT